MFPRCFLFGAMLAVLAAGCGSRRAVSPTTEPADGGGQPAGDCPSGLVKCGDRCVNLNWDQFNCGACNSTCGEWCDGRFVQYVCKAGKCSRPSCPAAGEISCCDICVDPATDNDNCGSCGTNCDTAVGFGCQNGKCSCPSGLTDCPGNCVDLTSDPANCGVCGNACSAGEYCASGACIAIGKWVVVSAGTFVMGSPPNEPCRGSCHGEETQHTVTLTHDFEISATEATQGEFLTLMGFNPAPPTSCGPTCPAEAVTWYMAAAYCNALSSHAGLPSCYSCSGTGPAVTCTEAAAYSGGKIYSCPGYRLPTDAEWEYAYRAGSITELYPTAGNNGSITACYGFDPNADKIGWYNYNSNGPHPVGTKPPNAWGLYNMAGNAHEWCHDRFESDLGSAPTTDPWGSASASDRVLRGGTWTCDVDEMRAACRFSISPDSEFGFRPCRTLSP